jgi:hypothetical protein
VPVTPVCTACSAYESFNAAVGLLGIYNDSILTEHPGQQQQEAAKWAFWLAAVEQVSTSLAHTCGIDSSCVAIGPSTILQPLGNDLPTLSAPCMCIQHKPGTRMQHLAAVADITSHLAPDKGCNTVTIQHLTTPVPVTAAAAAAPAAAFTAAAAACWLLLLPGPDAA